MECLLLGTILSNGRNWRQLIFIFSQQTNFQTTLPDANQNH